MKSLKVTIGTTGFIAILFFLATIFSGNANATCQSHFTWVQTSNNVINFTNTSTGTSSMTNYQYSFGDGNYDYIPNPVHTYMAPGHYAVCLTIFDSSSLCQSVFCDTVTVTGNVICTMTVSSMNYPSSCQSCTDGSISVNESGGTAPFTFVWSPNVSTTAAANNLLAGIYNVTVTDANNCTAVLTTTLDSSSCHAHFTWSQTSNNVISFTDASTGNNSFTNYYWTFGDNSYDYSQNPVHTYGNPGTYQVCLTISDSSFAGPCNSTYCATITVTGSNCFGFGIGASVTNATCMTCYNGAIATNVNNGTAPFTYTWTPNVGTGSSVYGLNPGTYSVCVSDAHGCTACVGATVDTTSSAGCSANFIVYPDSNTLHQYWAVNNATGAQPMHYYWTWGDNTSDTTAYPQHTYATAGVYTICLTVVDANGCSSAYCDSMYVQRTSNTMIYVNVIAPVTGIKENTVVNNWSVYPNPVSNSMMINYTMMQSADVTINLFDMLGNKVNEIVKANQSLGKHSVNVDAGQLAQGLYLLQITAGNKTMSQKISVVK